MFLTCITKCRSLCNVDSSTLSFVAVDATGELHKTLDKLEDSISSISSIAWNSKGDLILMGSYDSKVIIWDTITWMPKQQLNFDSGEI